MEAIELKPRLMSREIEPIPPSQVDIKNLGKIGYSKGLAASIARIGLQLPLIVYRRDAQSRTPYEIVDGRKRFSIWIQNQALASQPLPAKIIDRDELSVAETIFLRAHLNSSQRRFETDEISDMVCQLSEFGMPKKELAETLFPLTGQKANPELLEVFLGWSSLPTKLRDFFAEKKMAPSLVSSWTRLTKEQATRYAPAVINLKPSASQLREMGILMEELEAIGVSARKIAAELKSCEDANAAIQLLKQIRNPAMEAKLQQIRQLASNLKLPRGVSLEYSPLLESSQMQLRIRGQGRRELLELVKSLNKLVESDGFAELADSL